MRVLIAEDEPVMAEAVRQGLRAEAIAADVVADGASALEAVAITAYDVLILDRDLPVLSGDEVCRRVVKEYPHVRVLMLTAARSLRDRVAGFEQGADDYLVKPFDFPELIVRLRALQRRSHTAQPPVLHAHGIRLDAFRREVSREGRSVHLSRKEFAVLHLLMQADGGVVSAETLLEKAWDEHADPFSNSMRVTVSTLRKKLGEPTVIKTVPGVGYSFTS